jgi:hypothetical protein
MRTRRFAPAVALVAVAFFSMAGTSSAAPSGPTCSDSGLNIVVHGQHIIRDYVLGAASLEWPPAGQVGTAIGSDGINITGGPGPGFHFVEGFSPGASFCTAGNDSAQNATTNQQATAHRP